MSKMRRIAGEWLRDQLMDRVIAGGMFTALGLGWLLCIPAQLAGAPVWLLVAGERYSS
ncbi:MAG: hypothetical protein OXH15_01855 [Gammaproteobacteria bacterium]|nr:hypothetical protein [Gammaproteobacteria bacterium]